MIVSFHTVKVVRSTSNLTLVACVTVIMIVDSARQHSITQTIYSNRHNLTQTNKNNLHDIIRRWIPSNSYKYCSWHSKLIQMYISSWLHITSYELWKRIATPALMLDLWVFWAKHLWHWVTEHSLVMFLLYIQYVCITAQFSEQIYTTCKFMTCRF